LAVCADAVLGAVGVIAIDGTKVHANASRDRAMDYEEIARAIVEEAGVTDAAESAARGDRRGDELPEILTTRQGREGWLRDARQRLDQRRAEQAAPIPRSRPARLREGKRRLEEELAVERDANAQYEAYRARGRMKDGRRFGRPPNPRQPPTVPTGKVNLTDPDSKLVHGMRGWIHGYNAQAACDHRHPHRRRRGHDRLAGASARNLCNSALTPCYSTRPARARIRRRGRRLGRGRGA